MRTISILNFKGGTGKSSVAENLSHVLALQGYRVLVIDGDRQSNATTTLLSGRVEPSLSSVVRGEVTIEQAIKMARENLYVIPSDTDLDKASTHIVTTGRQGYQIMKRQLEKLHKSHQVYDFVFIDLAGAYSPLMEALLLASNEILIPCELESYAVQGLFDMFEKLGQELSDHELQNSGIIPYNIDFTKNMTKQYLHELQEEFGDLILESVRTDTTVPRAQSVHQTVFEYDPRSKAAQDFKRLSKRFLPVQQGV